MTETVQRLGSQGLRAAAAVTAAGVAVNALGYAAPLLGARFLSPGDLGALGSALALAAVASVVGLGLQTAVAVRQARRGSVRAGMVTAITAACAGGLLIVSTPLLAATLNLSYWVPPLMGVMTVAVVLGSRWLGEAQGAQRFHALAWGMAMLGFARYGGVIVGLATGAGVVGSLALGTAVAWITLPALALLAHRGEAVPVERVSTADLSLGRAVVAASSASLAMLTISYADLILARYFLSAADSGAYTVGAVLTKGALWAPGVVTIIALPRLARGSERTLRIAVAAVATCGAVLVLSATFAGRLAVTLAGGSGYEALAVYAPLFAATGALYAIAFVFLNARIAAGGRRPAAPLWIAVVGLVVVVALLNPPTIGRIVTGAVVTAAATTGVLAIMAWRRRATQAT